MISRRTFLALSALSSFTFSMSAFAGEATYTKELFQQYQAAGKSILIDISAPWCPTCRAQAPIIQKLSADAKYKDLEILKIDYDSQSDDVASFGANQQSTLIAFKGMNETGRNVGQTKVAVITDLLASSL
jgi:thioredoxin 1